MAKPIVNIKFLADLKQFSSGMQNANRQLENYGKKFQNLGATLSLAVTTPLLGLGAVAVSNFDKQAKAVAQVEQGLLSTGNAVGFTTDQLLKQASALQNNSLFGDEAILKDVTAQLLTFTNISGTAFERTQLAALDLATRLDGDLKSSAIQLGKALNDPVANLSALSRSGIQFSEDQKATINSLVQTNQLAEAQTIILNELEKQYGGSAAAAAKAGLGPFTQLKNIIGDITEEFGAIIIEGLNPFVEKLKSIATSFQNLSPETKKWIVILGGVAAAIGPLLALAGTILPAIATGFAFLISPIGLIIAGLTAIGVVIYKNWKPIKQTLQNIANYFIDLYNESIVFRAGVQSVILVFKTLFEVGKFVFETLKNIVGGFIDNFVNGFKSIGKIIKAVLTGNIDALPAIIQEAVNDSKTVFGGFTKELGNDWKTLTDNIKKQGDDALANITSRKKIEFLKDDVDASGLTEAVQEATAKGIIEGTKQGGQGAGRKKETALTGLTAVGPTQVQSPLAFAAAQIPVDLGIIDENLIAFQDRLLDFQEQTGQILANVAANFASGFADLVAGIANGTAGFGAVGGLLLQTLGDLASQIGDAAIKIGITMKAVKLSFTNPVAAIAAGIGLKILGSLLKSLASQVASGGQTAFADGGIVYGPTNALIGEYAGARNNPEVVAPLDKLKKLIQPAGDNQNIILGGGFAIKGDQLQLVLDRADKSRNRRS